MERERGEGRETSINNGNSIVKMSLYYQLIVCVVILLESQDSQR